MKPHTSLRPASVSMMVGAAVALMLLVVWYLLRTEEVLEAPQRTLDSVELKWKCDAGHVFYATGHALDSGGVTAPKTCVSCGQPAYPFADYTCQVHGRFDVVVRFAVDKDGVLDVSQVRLSGRDWLPRAQGLRCPRCDRPLVYVDDPLESVGADKRRGGG